MQNCLPLSDAKCRDTEGGVNIGVTNTLFECEDLDTRFFLVPY